MKQITLAIALTALISGSAFAKEYITHADLYQLQSSGEQKLLTSGDIVNDTDGSYSSPLTGSVTLPESKETYNTFLVSKVYKDKQGRIILNYNFELTKPERSPERSGINSDSEEDKLFSLETYSAHQSLVMNEAEKDISFMSADRNYILRLKVSEK